MPDFKTTVGSVEITSLSDGRLRFLPADFFPSVAGDDWEPYRDALTPDGCLLMNMGSFLLRSDGKTALVDTGLGLETHGLEALETGLLLKDMKRKGIRPDEIDMVIITHLHRDHVGWNFTKDDHAYRPTFPNARYWIPQADWRLFTRRTGMSAFSYIKDQVLPLEELGVLELMEGEQALTSEISALPTPGHTPGHTSVLVSSQGERAVITGDALHIPAQLHETHWSPRADSKPDQSAESRRRLVERAERENALLVSGHFAAPGYGRVARVDGRRCWQAL